MLEGQDLFEARTGGYPTRRIPGLPATSDGVVLATVKARPGGGGALRLDSDKSLKLEFHGPKITSDAGLLREGNVARADEWRSERPCQCLDRAIRSSHRPTTAVG